MRAPQDRLSAKANAEFLTDAYVVVEGVDEDNAFHRGCHGKGDPLWKCVPATPLFDLLFSNERVKEERSGKPSQDWIQRFFRHSRGWSYADDVGVVLRFSLGLAEKEAEFAAELDRQIESGHRIYVATDDLQAWRAVLAALTEPDEPLYENSAFGPVGLGEDPEYAAVCVRAVALMLMNELPRDGKLAVLRLPKHKKAGNTRRYLFFGWRWVEG